MLLKSVAQLNTIGTLKAQEDRPASSGIRAKGAARCTESTAARSSAELPELRATRMPLACPPEPTTKLTTTVPRYPPGARRLARLILLRTLPG